MPATVPAPLWTGDILTNNGTIHADVDSTIDINTKLLAGKGMEFITIMARTWRWMAWSAEARPSISRTAVSLSTTRVVLRKHQPQPATDEANGQIDLVGLSADSYDYGNDVLTLWNGNKIVDRLNLTGYEFSAYQTPTGVLLSQHQPYGRTVLPAHTWEAAGALAAAELILLTAAVRPRPGRGFLPIRRGAAA
jgi:hypothetical protein